MDEPQLYLLHFRLRTHHRKMGVRDCQSRSTRKSLRLFLRNRREVISMIRQYDCPKKDLDIGKVMLTWNGEISRGSNLDEAEKMRISLS